MTGATSDRDDFGELFITADEVSRRLAGKAAQIFRIDGSGNVIFETGFDDLTDNHTIGIVVLAHYIRYVRGVADSETITNHMISELSGINVKVVNARLAQLKKARFVVSPSRGKWKFVPAGAEKFLDDVIKAAENGQEA